MKGWRDRISNRISNRISSRILGRELQLDRFISASVQAFQQQPRRYSIPLASALSLVLISTGFAFRMVDRPAAGTVAPTPLASRFPKRTLKHIKTAPTQLQAGSVAILQPDSSPPNSPEKETLTANSAPANSAPANSVNAAASSKDSLTDSSTDSSTANSATSKATSPESDGSKPAQNTASPSPAAANPAPNSQPAAPETAAQAAPPVQLGWTIDDVLEMRVALAKGAGQITVGTSDVGVVTDLNGEVLKELSPQTGYSITAAGQGMSWDGTSLPSAVWVQPAESGYVAVGDRWYRGRLLLVNQGSGVYAINYVLLRDYLYGVVGTEVSSSWPIEAIRAQAVAARSYALTHNVRPASDLYDLDDTQRYQAYSGLSREASSIYEAVDSTSGEFISYQGGIVESLYAASDDIVQSVHGGLGMSQLGALEFAKQGYSYDQILAYYYPETAIARLDVGPD